MFSNEVDTKVTPLDAFEPGQPVLIEDASGHALGTGYVNPGTLISARLVSRDPKYILDQSLITHRLNIALSLRENCSMRRITALRLVIPTACRG